MKTGRHVAHNKYKVPGRKRIVDKYIYLGVEVSGAKNQQVSERKSGLAQGHQPGAAQTEFLCAAPFLRLVVVLWRWHQCMKVQTLRLLFVFVFLTLFK